MKKNIALIIIILIGLSVLSFIVTKSNIASFTHDESFTYNHYVHQSYFKIIFHTDPYTNNHLLNTILVKASEQLFGSSEMALRLPNILMLIVFFIYTWLLIRRNNLLIGIVVFGLMFTNNALIDFYGLARGYGLSIAFMVMSIYHLISSFNKNKIKNFLLFNITALLSILSNFTILDYYVAALFVYALIYFVENIYIERTKIKFTNTNLINILIPLIIFIILYEPVRKVMKFNSFDFGGKDGFLKDTLPVFINNCLDNIYITNFQMLILKIIFLTPIFISFIIIIYNISKRNKEFWYNSRTFYITNILLITISVVTIAQHVIFKTDYIIGRFSLFLYPLFVLNIGFLMEYLIRINKYKSIIISFAIVLLIVSSVRFFINSNLFNRKEWIYDCETKYMLNDLIKIHDEGKLKQNDVKLGINWVFEPTINFYRQTKHINWLLPVDRDGIKTTDDYFYIFNDSIVNIKPDTYTKLIEYNKSETVLLKNKK